MVTEYIPFFKNIFLSHDFPRLLYFKPPMMTIKMCLLPEKYGRTSGRPLATLGIKAVLVECRSYETCVESDDSKIMGNAWG